MMKLSLWVITFSAIFIFLKSGRVISADETEIAGIARAYGKTWNNIEVEPFLAFWHDDTLLTHAALYTKNLKYGYRGKTKCLMEDFPYTKIYDEKIIIDGDKATVKAIQDIGGFSYNITWDMV